MTKADLLKQVVAFRATASTLANSLHRIRQAIEEIEQCAQINMGELSQEDAKRHTVLQDLYDDAYEDIAEILNKFP